MFARRPSPRREVLVRIHAVSLNYRDKLMVTMPSLFRPGLVPLSDGAGEIVAVGDGVQRWQVGDRVAGCFFRDWESGRFQMEQHQAALGGSIDECCSRMRCFLKCDCANTRCLLFRRSLDAALCWTHGMVGVDRAWALATR